MLCFVIFYDREIHKQHFLLSKVYSHFLQYFKLKLVFLSSDTFFKPRLHFYYKVFLLIIPCTTRTNFILINYLLIRV